MLNIVVADISSMQNRALAMSLASSPYIITTIVGPQIAQKFYETIGFRWAFGVFALLTPLVAIPMFNILLNNQLKAKKIGILTPIAPYRSWRESASHYMEEFHCEKTCNLPRHR